MGGTSWKKKNKVIIRLGGNHTHFGKEEFKKRRSEEEEGRVVCVESRRSGAEVICANCS